MKRRSPGADLTLEQRLLVGTLAEREAEAKRQGVFEVWETRLRRNQNCPNCGEKHGPLGCHDGY
jgi:hypothetical protein